MTHLSTAETLTLLREYFVNTLRKSLVPIQIRVRPRSRRICRATRSAAGELQQRDMMPISATDFSDPESERVLDSMADALLEPLALQAARDDEAEWLASQQGHL